MYELKNGTKRLANALNNISEDRQSIEILSRLLNYYPTQLTQDIKALNDYIKQTEEQ